MKLIIAISILFINSSDLVLNAKDVTVNYNVKGMMCKMNCPDYIKEAAKNVDGVKKCEVDFDGGFASITFDDEKVDKSALISDLIKNTDNMYEIKIDQKESTQSWWDWLFGG